MLLSDESEPALLLVQGHLESVSNLSVITVNSTTVLISWIPPFTLKGVPILGYNLTINNNTSGENVTMLYYTIDDYLHHMNNFTVIVIPINEVGPGHPATFIFFLVFHHLISELILSISLSCSYVHYPHTVILPSVIIQVQLLHDETSNSIIV